MVVNIQKQKHRHTAKRTTIMKTVVSGCSPMFISEFMLLMGGREDRHFLEYTKQSIYSVIWNSDFNKKKKIVINIKYNLSLKINSNKSII